MKYLIDQCCNSNGHLDPKDRDRLQAFLDDPCVETWEEAHSLIIRVHPMMTVWQAWIATDPKAPWRGRAYDFDGNLIREWDRIPSAFAILRALEFATEKEESP